MAKFAKGEYLDGLNNGEPIFYKDEFTQKMVSEDKFSESKAYAIGDYCIYDNTLYKFTASKTAGAWNASVVEAVTITGELSELNSNLTFELASTDDINNCIISTNVGMTYNIHLPSSIMSALFGFSSQGWGLMSILTSDICDLFIVTNNSIIITARWTKGNSSPTAKLKLTATSF